MNQGETLDSVLRAHLMSRFRATLWVDGSATGVQLEYGPESMVVSGLQGDGIPSTIRLQGTPPEVGVQVREDDDWTDVTGESPDLLLFGILDPRLIRHMLVEQVAHTSLLELGWPERDITVTGSLRGFVDRILHSALQRLPDDFLEWAGQPHVDKRNLTFQVASDPPLNLVSLLQPDLSPELSWLELRFQYPR